MTFSRTGAKEGTTTYHQRKPASDQNEHFQMTKQALVTLEELMMLLIEGMREIRVGDWAVKRGHIARVRAASSILPGSSCIPGHPSRPS